MLNNPESCGTELMEKNVSLSRRTGSRKKKPKPRGDAWKNLYSGVYRSSQKVTITNFFDPLQSKAMTKKQWLALLALYVTYLLLGALVFYFLEKDHESLQRDSDYRLYERLVAVVKECGLNQTTLLDLENYCSRPLSENADLETITPRLWDFYNSVFFVITVVSTVGYGNIHPTTPLTRVIMMFYAIIGVPMNGILLTSLAQFFSNVFIKAHKKYKRYESRCGLAVDVFKYLVPGILFFIFVPATAFYYFEGWTYEESVYFAFVTLTTIGFGDMVAGQKQFKEYDREVISLYKSLLLCWIIFGLGYLIMILGFITRAMRSKKMAQFEHKVIEALTHSKIWHGFSKDIGYLRRLMNELYLDKFKPVYFDDFQEPSSIFHRSKSLPNFAFGAEEESVADAESALKRSRAVSDIMTSKFKISRVCSESDLHRIDRSATFASVAEIQPDELIRHVVGAMGGSLGCHVQGLAPSGEPKGIDVFSDDEILKSEDWDGRKEVSGLSLNYPPSYEKMISPKRKRVRALSECPPMNSADTAVSVNNLEWTWSGTGSTKIFDIVNERHRRTLEQQNLKSKSRISFGNFVSGSKWIDPWRKRVKSQSESMSESKKDFYSNGDLRKSDNGSKTMSDMFVQLPADRSDRKYNSQTYEHYVTYNAGSGTRGIGLMHGKQTLAKPKISLYELYKSGDHLFSNENRQEVLEENSLAEFLRVLSSLHSRIGPQRGEELQQSPANAARTSPKIESLVNLFSPVESPAPRRESSEKLQEPSNLRRLGRFLLRSYSAAPKIDSNADSLIGSDSNQPANSKPLHHRYSDIYLADNYYTIAGNPSVKIDVPDADAEDESSGKNFSNFNVEDPVCSGQETSRTNDIMSNLSSRMRRGSTPLMPADASLQSNSRSRKGLSSESVFSDSRPVAFPRLQSMVRRRPGELRSAKPSLSDVKEVVK